ncbi:hypothetical protein FIA58_018740 [Flavobacterium jejuense]|uniref:HTH cro/C1-type domain-containing protein n=1 Tax=Flavobacterium jejuense TaxID=1544455 RepID=A0ABX0IY16_9FLAO|nr:hypothetical protein [Flavobacterium jejuense]NHN27724.1 hypothetical protein [Flavobacterium jejuense]
METLHVGKLLKDYIDSKKIAKSALARKINKDDSTIAYYQKKASLPVSVLLTLCHALKHNFFQDLANTLPSSYSGSVSESDTKDTTIKQLQEEIKILKAEKEVLLQVLKK